MTNNITTAPTSPSNLAAIATHESAHCAAMFARSISIAGASVSERSGYVDCVVGIDSHLSRAIVAFAGFAGERQAGFKARLTVSDKKMIRAAAAKSEMPSAKFIAMAWREAVEIVRQWRKVIPRLAGTLAERKTMTGVEVCQVLTAGAK